MDISSLSVMSSQANFQNQASLMVMKKVMDTSEQNGQEMIALLESASVSPPHLGQTVDISA